MPFEMEQRLEVNSVGVKQADFVHYAPSENLDKAEKIASGVKKVNGKVLNYNTMEEAKEEIFVGSVDQATVAGSYQTETQNKDDK